MPRVAQGHSKRHPIQKDEGDLGKKNIRGTLKRFFTETHGFETVEYGIMTSIIIIAIVASLVLMMVAITETFATAATLVK